MRRGSVIGLALALATQPGQGASAPARVGILDVRSGPAGVPCFSTSRAEQRRSGPFDFNAISVNLADSPRTTVWSMTMPSARTFTVSHLMCVPYAGRLPVLPQTPAATLVAGTLYEVTIEARGAAAPEAPRHYRARFCIARQVPKVRTPLADARGRLSCPD